MPKGKPNAGQFYKWTSYAESFLRHFWPTWTATEIATTLKCSRNAVIGKAHHLKLPPKAPRRLVVTPVVTQEAINPFYNGKIYG